MFSYLSVGDGSNAIPEEAKINSLGQSLRTKPKHTLKKKKRKKNWNKDLALLLFINCLRSFLCTLLKGVCHFTPHHTTPQFLCVLLPIKFLGKMLPEWLTPDECEG